VTAALRIVDRRGLDALTMRAVGSTLGYEAMSLYKHVANKQELLNLVADRVVAELETPDVSATWQDRLRHIAGEWRRMALAHPHVFQLLATGPPPSPASLLPFIDAHLGALREATGDDAAAVSYFWTFLSYTTGALIAECAAIASTTPPQPPTPVDPDALPHLAALREVLAGADLAEGYQRSIEILIASVSNVVR
jgi:AcrR family transcriptional regulator